VLAAIAQPIFQVLVPIYPELWFNLQGRGTVTAVLSMSNIVGGVFLHTRRGKGVRTDWYAAALAQLLSPIFGGPRPSILMIGIITTVLSPCCFLVGSRPPTPPSVLYLFTWSILY
jgi:FLVCR family MFS transporter 7